MMNYSDLRRWACVLVMLITGGFIAHAQLEKLFIDGRFIDGQSGVAIMDAELTVIDSLDKKFVFRARPGIQGQFSAALYSGAHYALQFRAPGYLDRCAVIDLKADRDWPDVSQVWNMSMDVPMWPAAANAGAPAGCDWRCEYQPRSGALVWKQDDAKSMFPITKAANTRDADELEMSYKRGDNRYVLVKGFLKDLRDDRAIGNAQVRFTPDSGADSLAVTDDKGYYEMKMSFDQPFRVTYAAEGKVAKIVEVDPRTVPQKERKQGFVVWIDITLFAPVPDADLSFLAEPIGRAAYDEESRTISWDMEYSLPRMERLNKILGER